jgi:hypothetical protein
VQAIPHNLYAKAQQNEGRETQKNGCSGFADQA